tara:strand:+ start:186 stop:515 length:330 start_codon:yes stop_codon:yes gene_type:complete
MNKVTDNVELDFPARMSDGRQFTDYRQNCLLNNNLSNGAGSWEYRQYLTINSDQIRNSFLQQQVSTTACTKCSDNTVLPVKTIINCSPTGCDYQLNDPNGLGVGVNYLH